MINYEKHRYCDCKSAPKYCSYKDMLVFTYCANCGRLYSIMKKGSSNFYGKKQQDYDSCK